MRKVAIGHRANEQLLEMTTLAVYEGERSRSGSLAILQGFEDVLARLEDDSIPIGSVGEATTRFYGLIQNPERRTVRIAVELDMLLIIFSFRETFDECLIESVTLV